MNKVNFYTPDEVRSRYSQIIPVYQAAFAGEPWNEVSKCPDQRQRCVGGLSSTALGSLCGTCGVSPYRPAYEASELAERFDSIADSRPTEWYIEESKSGITLAAIAWLATDGMVAREKYRDNSEMAEWLDKKSNSEQYVWLDEVFADKKRQSSGNLKNFDTMILGFSDRLGSQSVAYRTISQQMVGAAWSRFGANRSKIYAGDRDREEILSIPTSGDVPDRRDVVIINTKEN